MSEDSVLRKLRLKRGLTTTEIAARIGISQSRYSAIELGTAPWLSPSGYLTGSARKICKYYKVSARALFGWEPPERAPTVELTEIEGADLLGPPPTPEELVILMDLFAKLAPAIRPYARQTVAEYICGATLREIADEAQPRISFHTVHYRYQVACQDMHDRYRRLHLRVPT